MHFANVTSGSDKCLEYLQALEGCILGLAEVHKLHPARFYSKLPRYAHNVGKAIPSEDSTNGTYGGTSASIRHRLVWSPLSGSVVEAKCSYHKMNKAFTPGS